MWMHAFIFCVPDFYVTRIAFKKRKKAAFLLIFFRDWNIIKIQLETTNQRLPP